MELGSLRGTYWKGIKRLQPGDSLGIGATGEVQFFEGRRCHEGAPGGYHATEADFLYTCL